MDVDAEREKIAKEIAELERILDPSSSSIGVGVSESGLALDSDADSLPEEDSDAADSPVSEEERWGEASNGEDDPKEKNLPEDPETCLQLNMVYQEVIQERLAEVSLLLAQNREQQEEIMSDLAGSKGPKVKDGKILPPNLYIGHFMKPYFKDRVTGVGPPANEETREKAAQGIKAFEELLVTKWKNWEKALLRRSVVSDRLQRLLQPKLLKLEYLHQKQSRVTSEAERQVLEKQSREAETEAQDIRKLPEEALLGNRLDNHDWEKISNVNFEGSRSAEEIRKFWQNFEHPSINKQEWSGQEVDQLKAIAAKHGHLQWQTIAKELGTNRSAFQCLQKYQQHNKALKRKEWTREEDRLLTQLVQEMRVGSHIPYRRIVYYMEGRDSMQLIYRWTKSLDPSLKKGFWAPEEDAKLLQAVAKYGEQDWFKIREEVPGRSDAQCRDRYLRRLHFSLKKGRWNASEEEKLVELIEKYGVGHWAKIASELPHRTGSQCLSKWKIMVRKKQNRGRRRRRPLRRVRWSSSSGDTSSEDISGEGGSGNSEDSEPEEAPETEAGGQAPPSTQHTVPDMDLWVPARQSASEPCGAGGRGWPGHHASPSSPPQGSSKAQDGSGAIHPTASAPTEEVGRVHTPSRTHSTSAGGIGHPDLVDTHPLSSEEPANKEKLRQSCLLSSSLGASPGDSSVARPRVRQLWHRTTRNRRRWRGQALQRRLLEYQLLMAMSSWVGDVLPCTSQRPVTVHTQADGLRKQLQDAQLTSTPVFTLFIQLFQIDTTGCMEVVRERKAQSSALLQTSAQDPGPGLLQMSSSTQNATGTVSDSVTHPAWDAGRPGPQALWAEPPLAAPANVDTDSDPPSRTDLLTIPVLCQSQNSVEMGGDVAHASGGPAFPGEAQVAREIAMPRIPSQATLLADHPEAKPCRSSQPPMQAESGPGETPGSPRPGGLPGPLGLERPPPPRPRPEKGALDLDLLSQESEAAVREWLRGKQGVCVPPLGSRLPYQPPALCSLRALSGLLLHKKTLEQRATSLMPSGAAGALQASLGQVRRQLQDSPAYLLLKARFLAAFTLPALLATLSPHGVPTTLSVATRADPESEDDLGELELTCGPQAGPAATIPVQGAPDSGQSLDGCDTLDVRRTRHAWHARKRRRLV
ncbi:unnamed protein product [Nyctereutes procyonoides]|uniref:snRNA-activating protein complex subunit 4 n=2 Tax=Nyctereutes procyonoides TaxID=34880 RepID=A0A811XWK5_NYCPR|nr:unnamed protein product [Nyctereutes procyonoides]